MYLVRLLSNKHIITVFRATTSNVCSEVAKSIFFSSNCPLSVEVVHLQFKPDGEITSKVIEDYSSCVFF